MFDLSEWEPSIQTTIGRLRTSLSQMQKIWSEIGFTEQECSIYCQQAFSHINDLLSDMVSETELKKKTVLSNIEQLMAQIVAVSKELGRSNSNEGYEHFPLKELEQVLVEDLQKLEFCKEQRMAHLKELLAKERSLCKILGTQPIGISEELPTEEELNSFMLYLEKQEGEKNRLESIFKEMRRAIVKMMDDLGISPSTSFEHLICKDIENFVLSSSNMTKLRELRDKLKEQADMAEEHVEDIKQDLIALWKYLDEPERICHSFINSYVGYSVATINALETELQRCKEKRTQNISKYVSQVRSELVKLWDMCKFSEEQRGHFIHFNSHSYTEDLLTLHELEVKRVQKFYEANKSIFELLEERDNLWTKMKELLQRANNPDRFYNRGGQLLMEEKERKTIQKKLPKIEEQLRSLIKDYENMHGEIFTVNGMSMDELLKESWEHLNTEKATVKKARKEAKDKSMKKVTLSASKKTATNSTKKTPTLLSTRRHIPLSTSKRKLFSPSPNTSAKCRNTSITPNGSKRRRSGKVSMKILQTRNKTLKRQDSISQSSAGTDTTYSDFREHLEERKELRSSLLPEQVLANATRSKIKTPVRTPKPLRKNIPIATTPKLSHSQSRKSPHSPRLVQSSRLATVSTPLPIIF